jgi:predicted amidohydrolase YtcJ
MSRFMPRYAKEQNKEAIMRAQAEMLGRGVTTIYDAHVEPEPDYFMAYEELARAGKLKLRTRGAWFVPREAGGEDKLVSLIDRCAGYADLFQTGRFRVTGFKFLLDMTVEAETACLLAPYQNRGDWRGVRVWEDGELLSRLFSKIDRMGFQIHLHQMGDGAAQYALDALERAGNLRTRHTFAHCQLLSDADKARMAKLGVSALAAPYWINSSVYSSAAVPSLGLERAARQYPVKSLLDAGVNVGAHSDYTVSEPSFCGAVYGLTERRLAPCAYRRFFPFGPPEARRSLPSEGERVSVREAVKIMTLGGAHSMCEEGETGSVAPGKAADLALLSGDIEGLCEAEGCVEVDMTVCAGEVAFER